MSADHPSGARPWNVAGATVTLMDKRDALEAKRSQLASEVRGEEFYTERKRAEIRFIDANLKDIADALRVLEPEHFGDDVEREEAEYLRALRAMPTTDQTGKRQ